MKPVAKVYDSNRRAGEFYYKVRLLAIVIEKWDSLTVCFLEHLCFEAPVESTAHLLQPMVEYIDWKLKSGIDVITDLSER